MKLNTLTKFLLVAHHPEKGRFLISDAHINFGIIGAALLEISLDEQIKIEDNKLILLKTGNSENTIITDISKEIKNSKKDRKVKNWITKLSRKSSKYKWEILADLEKSRLIRIEDKRFLGLIPYRKSYLIERNTRNELIDQLKKDALFGRDLNNDTILMLGLIEACKMHKIITSDKKELKKLKQKLKDIIKENAIADTVDKTIKQVQATIIGATVATTIATSGSS
jgi:hypothetical protein